MEVTKKLQKLSLAALTVSLLPLFTLVPVFLKATLPDGVRTVWAVCNIVLVLSGLLLSVICVKGGESRSMVNILSTIISTALALMLYVWRVFQRHSGAAGNKGPGPPGGYPRKIYRGGDPYDRLLLVRIPCGLLRHSLFMAGDKAFQCIYRRVLSVADWFSVPEHPASRLCYVQADFHQHPFHRRHRGGYIPAGDRPAAGWMQSIPFVLKECGSDLRRGFCIGIFHAGHDFCRDYSCGPLVRGHTV